MDGVDEARLILARHLSVVTSAPTTTSDVDELTAAFRVWLDAISDRWAWLGRNGGAALVDEAMTLLALRNDIEHALGEAMLLLGVRVDTPPAGDLDGP